METINMIPISDTEEFIEASIKEEEQWHKQYDSFIKFTYLIQLIVFLIPTLPIHFIHYVHS